MNIQVENGTLRVRGIYEGQVLSPNHYGAIVENHFKAKLEAVSPYELFTTFYSDLSVAEYFGEKGIRETFNNVCESWLNDYKYFTEFVLCLNWKIWAWHDLGCDKVAKVYDELWKKADAMLWEKYEGNEEATGYAFRVLD